MKKHLFLLLSLVMLFSIGTVSSQSSVYLFEDFENVSYGLPDGWQVGGNTVSYSNWKVWTANLTNPAHQGAKCLTFDSNYNGQDNTGILYSPSFSVVDRYTTVSFWAINKLGGPMNVYLSLDGGNTYGDILLDSIPRLTEWTKMFYSLKDYIGQTVSIVIVSTSNYSQGGYDSNHYIDEFKVYAQPICATPEKVTSTEVTNNSATISWSDGDEGDIPSSYIISVWDENDNYIHYNTPVQVQFGIKTFHLSGLEPNTKYFVAVKGDCFSTDRGVSNFSDVHEFTTMCDGIALPYYNDFNQYAANYIIPDCWVNCSDSRYTGTYSGYKYGSTGRSFCLYSSTTASNYFTTMAIDHPANDIQVEFMLYSNYYTSIRMGLMRDPKDFSTFDEISNFRVAKNNTWEKFSFNTTHTRYNDTRNLYICFIIERTANAYGYYFDDLKIIALPNCVQPSNFVSDLSDSTSISFKWSGSASCNEYQVEVSESSNFVNSTITTFNTTSGIVSGLNTNTSYYCRARAVCGNDTSDWSKEITVTTSCSACAVPFYENFDASMTMPSCWQIKSSKMNNSTSGTFYPWRMYGTPNPYGTDGNCLFSANSTTGEGRNIAITPAVSVPGTGAYELSFFMRRDNYSNPNNRLLVYVNSKPTLEGATLIDSVSVNTMSYPIVEEGAKFYEIYYDLPMSGTVYVIFESVFFYSGNLLIDKVSIAPKLACRAEIYGLSNTLDEYNNTFTLNWKTQSGETQWGVDFDLINASTSEVVHSENNVVVSDSTYTFNYGQYIVNGTSFNVEYSIRALCTANDTSLAKSSSFSFTTTCDVQSLPITASFDGTKFPPLCWISATLPNSASPNTKWSRSSSAAHGSGAAQFPMADSVTIGMLHSPRVNLTAGTVYQVSFNMLRNTIDKIKNREGLTVWVSSTPSDTTYATKLCNIHREFQLSPVEVSTGFHNYAYTFNVNTTGEYYIIFAALQEGGSAIVIDDVVIEEKPVCSKIEIDVVTDVEVGFNDADITINANDMVELAVVEMGTSITDSVLNSAVTGRYTISSSNKVVTVGNLQGNTSYYVYIRRVCDDTNNVTSIWSTSGVSFTTFCAGVDVRDSLMFVDGFENYSANVILSGADDCYEYNSTVSLARPYIKTGLGNYWGQTGTVCTPFAGSQQLGVSADKPGWVGYPVHLYPGRTYEVSVYARTFTTPSMPGPSSLTFYLRKVKNGGNDNTSLSPKFDVVNEWDKYTAQFAVTEESVYYVGFEFEFWKYGRYMTFDEFIIKEATCATPQELVVTATSFNSASFSMQSSGSQWEVRICTSKPALGDNNPEAVLTEFVNTPAFTVNNLVPNTDYYCVVRKVCTNEVSEWTKPVAFSTECYTKNLPYTETFEAAEELRCWSSMSLGNGVMETSSVQARYGNSSLKLQSIYAISPELNVTEIANCMISGWVYAEQSEPTEVSFGVIVDKYDNSTYETVINFRVEKANQWVRFVVYLNGLNDPDYEDFVNAKHIVISCFGDNVYYFDDVEVATVPSCPKTSFAKATVENGTNIKVEWPSYGNETSWVVSVNQVVDGEMSFLFDSVTTTNSYTFHNLPAIRYYSFGVTSVCAANDSSDAVYSDPIKAPCIPVSLPYEVRFDNVYPDCWNTTANTSNPSREWMYNNEGYFYAYPYKGEVLDTAYLEFPEFVLRHSNGVNVEVTGFIHSSFDNIPVRLEYSIDGGATYTTTSTNILNYNVLGITTVTVPQIGPGIVKFRIVAEKQVYCNLYVYGCKVTEIEDCSMPQSINVSNTNDVVTVHIHGAGSNWEYVYEKGGFNPDYRTPIATSQNDIVLSNLDLSSIYNIYIRTICNQEHSSWAGPFIIKTRCVEPLPYDVNFNNISRKEDILTECYYVYNGRPGNEDGQLDDLYPYVSTDYQSGALSLTSSSEYPIYVVLPEFDSDVSDLNLAFEYKNEGNDSYNENLIVGIVNPSNYDSFIPVYLCPVTSSLSRVNVDFTKLLSINRDYTGFQIAFRYGGNEFDGFYVTIDNINVTKSAKCSYNPELRLSGVSENSVSFNAMFFADSIEVASCGLGETIAENPANVVGSSSRTITVDNLVNGTVYDFYVRNVCRGTRGEWCGPITVATECNAITITNDAPWTDNFNTISNTNYPFPDCLTRVMTYQENGVTYPLLVNKNVNGLEMKGENIIALPKFNNNPTNYSVSLFVRGYGDISVGAVNSSNINNFILAYDASILSDQVRYDVDLSEYSIPGNRIAIKSYEGSNFIIDSVVVYNLGTCYQPRITNISQLADTFAVVAFNMPSSATGYQYLLKAGENETLTTMTSAASELTISGLTPNTNYELSINSVCGNDTSAWSTITFTTSPSALRAPFAIDFESSALNSYFTMTEDSGNKFMIGDGSVAEDVTGMVPGEYGDACLFLSNAGKYTYAGSTTNVSYFYAPVYFAPGNYSVDYNWLSTGEDCCDYGRVFLAPVDVAISHNVLMDGVSATTTPDDFIALDGNNKLNGVTDWRHNSAQFAIDKGVVMNLVVMWYNDASGNTTTYPLAIDNITLNYHDCDRNIESLNVVEITESFAKFNVQYDADNVTDSIKVFVRNNYGNPVSVQNINISNNINNTQLVDVTGLTPNSIYSIEVFGYCSEGISVPVYYTFNTLCTPLVVTETAPYLEDFEGINSGAYFEDEFECWAYNQLQGGVKVATASINGGKLMSLPFTNKVSISRPFSLAADTYELSLYAYQTSGKGNVEISVRKRGADNWTVLVNQNVREFIEPVVGKLTVTEAAVYDVKIVFDATISNSGYLYFDDLSIKPSDCIRPSNLVVTDITSHSATISWKGFTDVHRLIIVNQDHSDYRETLVENGSSIVEVDNLNLVETYTVYVNPFCDADDDFGVEVTFSTVCDVLTKYHNDFDDMADFERPSCWSLEASQANGALYLMDEEDLQWRVKNIANHRALVMKNSASVTKAVHTLYSPEFRVQQGSEVSFDCYNNVYNDYHDSLVVTIVSGETESLPIAVFTAEDINGVWNHVSYKLSAYTNETVRFKFTTRTGTPGTGNQYVAIDNFVVNSFVQGDVYNVTLCANNDYTENGFNVNASQLTDGIVNTVQRISYSEDAADTLYTANIFVPKQYLTEIYDTLCNGEIYNKGLFTNLTKNGRYSQKTTSTQGCDSTVILHLTEIDIRTVVYENICEGDTYTFGNEVLSQTGVYIDTIPANCGCDSVVTLFLTVAPKYYEYSKVICEQNGLVWGDTLLNTTGRYERKYTNWHGCDSIEVINLEVIPADTYVTVEICQGQSYFFFNEEISEEGEYTKVFANSLGCDSMVHLTLHVVEPAPAIFDDYVCEGQGYYNYGFEIDVITQDTVVTRRFSKLDGCDTVIVVNVDFIPTIVENITVTISDGDSYEFGGNTLTVAGNYQHRFYSSLGCDSIVNLTLNVTTDVDNVYTLPIVVAPNPVYGGQTTYVTREWTAEEQNGMRVEVLNAVGQLITSFAPTTYPIEVGGLNASGVYYIRITSGTGDVYIGRLVVK